MRPAPALRAARRGRLTELDALTDRLDALVAQLERQWRETEQGLQWPRPA